MWNSIKSVKLSAAFTKVVMALTLLFAVALPIIVKRTPLSEMFIVSNREINYILPIILVCAGIALIALYYLDRLLTNIAKEAVFTLTNVRTLRIISWCCMLAAVVLVFGSFFSLTFLLMAIMAGFIGLILRVVKNVFEAAVKLKTENDYTI